jgi:hypothetical protein
VGFVTPGLTPDSKVLQVQHQGLLLLLLLGCLLAVVA